MSWFNWKNWKWLLVVVAGALLLFFSEGARSYRQKKKYLGDLERKLSEAREANRNLTMEIHRLRTDPRAIEPVARRELGLAQPGEIEYRFVVRRSSGDGRE